MSLVEDPIFSRDHDEVGIKSVADFYIDYFPSDWTDEEIEEWVFLDKQRRGRRVLRREIEIQSRQLYRSRFNYGEHH